MPKNKGKRTMSDQNEKLLVVEDTFLIAMQLQMDLKSLGYSVAGPAPSVERAFKILDREPVKAALTLPAGLLLGWVMLRGRSPAPCIGLHMGWNLVFAAGLH